VGLEMARQQKKNNKKVRLPGFVEDMRDAVMRKAVTALVVVIFICVSVVLVKAFLYKSDYFRLRVVETRAVFLDQRAAAAMNSQLVNLYKGRNMFNIPLNSIAQSVRSAYADVKDVTVRIALPDKLVIELKLRKPVAYVRNTKIYPIDEDGVVLPPVGTQDLVKNLPAIDGINIHNNRKGPSRNLMLALDLLGEIQQTKLVTQYGISSINAADPRSMSFYLKNGLEVRIGSENFENRLEALTRTLKDPRIAIDKILYIDVRFGDVVIGPK